MREPPVLVLREVRLGTAVVDVAVVGARVAAIGATLDVSGADAQVIFGDGAAVLPGLHDHHIHLLAAAAALDSVDCGPPAVRTRADLGAALAGPPGPDGWVRGIGYDESVAGDLDRTALDQLRPEIPVRVQHRGGAMWMVNSAGARALRLHDTDLRDVERDAAGVPTGRLWRMDQWMGERIGLNAPDIARLSAALAARGVTGVTDATPELDEGSIRLLAGGPMVQRVRLLGDPNGTAPWKIVVADHDLPALDSLVTQIRVVRPRAVALHAVTRAALILVMAALDEVGAVVGDRIEHAAVVPPELLERLRDSGVTVVTQPSLPARWGDEYLAVVDPDDREHLWPYASLLAAGVPVGCSSDAPYGDLDPWVSVRAAVSRTTAAGRPIGPRERVSAETALAGYLSVADDPGGPARLVEVGATADLVLADCRGPGVEIVATVIAGRVVHHV